MSPALVPFAATQAEDPDVLDRAKCLQALADLRHAKWFQVLPYSFLSVTTPNFHFQINEPHSFCSSKLDEDV